MELHPIMYVPDQYAEREFYAAFGFETTYEGVEFPGFLAMRRGQASFGLQRASAEHPAYTCGMRWQFELTNSTELDEVIATCARLRLNHEVLTEVGGTQFRTRLVSVTAPSGCTVWFEGPKEVEG